MNLDDLPGQMGILDQVRNGSDAINAGLPGIKMGTGNYTGTHFGVFAVSRDATGKVTLAPSEFERDPTPIMGAFAELLTSRLRILKPAVRKGFLEHGPASRARRGDEPFVEVEWDVALTLAAENLRAVYESHGPASVYGGSYGWASAGRFHHSVGQLHRFLNCLGGYTASVNTYSHAAAEVLLPHIIGTSDHIMYAGTTWPVIRDHTKLIVAFGGLPSVTGQISQGGVSEHSNAYWVRQCAGAGVKMITIGPTQSHIDADLGCQWIAPRPNTDTALMLALAYQLVKTDQYDKGFVQRYTVGFDRFLPYLTGKGDHQPKTPEWAAEICGIPAEIIVDLAEQMGKQRCLLTSTWALQRAHHGEQPFWMLVVLGAMLGQIGLPGGGLAFGLTSFNGVGYPVHRRSYGALPQGENPVTQRIPVARITELLENPGGQIDYDGGKITFPDIKAVYWAGGNPFHHHQDLNRLQVAWRNPDVVIVNELEWNPTARRADIVFPVASVMERNDVMAPKADRRLIALKQCADPVGQSKTDYEIFSRLAEMLGVAAEFTQGRDEQAWLRVLHRDGQRQFAAQGVNIPDFDAFWAAGVFEHCPQEVARVALADFRRDPDAHPLTTASGRIEIFCEAIAGFGYDDCPGHPTWLEPDNWLGAKHAQTYPLHLMSPQPRSRLHGQLDGNGASAESKIQGREPAYLNAREAMKRGLKDGDLMRLFNDTGAVLCGVRVVDWVADNVVALPTGAWFSPDPQAPETCLHGNPNTLSTDRGTSRLSQGPAPNSTLVQAEKYTGAVNPVAVHTPPDFLD